jgi:hypothetical protein
LLWAVIVAVPRIAMDVHLQLCKREIRCKLKYVKDLTVSVGSHGCGAKLPEFSKMGGGDGVLDDDDGVVGLTVLIPPALAWGE